MKRLLAYAQLVRLPNTFTALADIALGALATGSLPGRWLPFVCLLAASTALYWSGMVWNDWFDQAEDRKERPGRPLPSGRVSAKSALLLGVALMIAGVGFAALADTLSPTGQWIASPLAALVVVSIFLYDGALKKSWAGPIAMGLCRFFNVLLGLSVAGTWPPTWGWLLAFVVFLYIVGVTWFARTEAKLSDPWMLRVAAGIILAALVLALTVPALAIQASPDAQPSKLFPYLLALFGFYLSLAILPAINHPVPQRVQAAIKRSVLGLVLLDALLASALIGPLGLLLALLLIPGLLLGRWLYST